MIPKQGWYIGKWRGEFLTERCYGWVVTGYWYAGGPENTPYSHYFWGFVWDDFTFGIGRVRHDD